MLILAVIVMILLMVCTLVLACACVGVCKYGCKIVWNCSPPPGGCMYRHCACLCLHLGFLGEHLWVLFLCIFFVCSGFSLQEHLHVPVTVNMHYFVWNFFMRHIEIFFHSFMHACTDTQMHTNFCACTHACTHTHTHTC